jgi:hypothetical protein
MELRIRGFFLRLTGQRQETRPTAHVRQPRPTDSDGERQEAHTQPAVVRQVPSVHWVRTKLTALDNVFTWKEDDFSSACICIKSLHKVNLNTEHAVFLQIITMNASFDIVQCKLKFELI